MKNKNNIGDKSKLLIYAHYYYPDVASTGQIIQELSEGMKDFFDITVICTIPSYTGIISEEYSKKKYYTEDINGIQVIRVKVPAFNKEKKVSRVVNILTYFFCAIKATGKVNNVDYVYSISQPPILGGLLGVWGKWRKGAKFLYNIQDFNPEQITATGYSKSKFILKILLALDVFCCKQANKVIVVGRDMVFTLKRRFRDKKMPSYVYINNWINETEIYPLKQLDQGVISFRETHKLIGKYVVMYSGNIGLYYDLENILKALYQLLSSQKNKILVTPDGKEVVFVFIGEGSIRNRMVEYVENCHMKNVMFLPYQKKSELVYSLNAADVHWCVSAAGIKGVSVPSKIYGILSCGKPVLGVMEQDSEARLLIEETNCGLVCDPGDYESIKKNVLWFLEHSSLPEVQKMGERGRDYLLKFLTMDKAINRYAEEIKSC